MRHLIVIYLTFMMGLNVACSRVEDLGKDDLHSEPTIEIVSGDTLDIVGFTLAHELATTEGYCMIRLSSISFVPRMERIWMYGFLVNHRN